MPDSPAAVPAAAPTTSAAAAFRYTRLTAAGKLRTHDLAEAMGGGPVSQQTWMFVAPHDDDLSVGAGMLIQAAVRAGIRAQVIVVTDGCMGYCRADEQPDIIGIRRRETFASFAILGVPEQQVTYIGYPDGGLTPYIGRRAARPDEEALAGFVGLQNAFTYYLRKFRPTRIFVPTHTDLHPDHRITHSELMISLFHATGAIWPELGPPLKQVPQVGELAVYCDFGELPNVELIGSEAVFQTKLAAIGAYESQIQIKSLVDRLREAGPYEYLRDSEFRLFSPENYKKLFA